MGDMPDSYNVVVNSNHPLVSEILNEKDDKRKATLSKQLVDLAKLSQGLLKGKDLADFVKRSVEIIK
jgi:molecular chaperone HtpG